jgi:excisionase family DNA binding protein
MAGTLVGLHDRPVRAALRRAALTHSWRSSLLSWPDEPRSTAGRGWQLGSAVGKGCAGATQPSGKATPELPSYLRAAEVAAILQVSPKTVSRWATEGKVPFLKTLGGHRRYPAAEIRQLADELQVQPTT